MAEPAVCVRHGLMLTRRYSLSTWKPTGEPFCPACEPMSAEQDERPMAGCHACDEPLVLTFEFRGKEFICVVCGELYEFFGPKHLEWTPERQARHDELAAKYDAERKERARQARSRA